MVNSAKKRKQAQQNTSTAEAVTDGNGTEKKKFIPSLKMLVAARLRKLVSPILSDAARALCAGDFKATSFTDDMSTILEKVVPTHIKDESDIDGAIPVAKGAGRATLTDSQRDHILKLRAEGCRIFKIARLTKHSGAAIRKCISDAGDPNPEVAQQEKLARKAYEQKQLEQTARRLGVTVAQLKALKSN